MGYAVRPLNRIRAQPRRVAPRHHSSWVPSGGSAQYVVTDSLPTIEIGNTTTVIFSAGIAAGGHVRPIMRRNVRIM